MAKILINDSVPLTVKTGDIIMRRNEFNITKPSSYLATAIRKFDGTEYNHALIVVENWGVPHVNEAEPRGILNPVISDGIGNGNKYLFLRPKIAVNEEFIARRANSVLGRKYDKANLLIHQPIYILSGGNWWIGKGKGTADGRMVCTEYIAWCYAHYFDKWHKAAPSDILDSIHFQPYFDKVINDVKIIL